MVEFFLPGGRAMIATPGLEQIIACQCQPRGPTAKDLRGKSLDSGVDLVEGVLETHPRFLIDLAYRTLQGLQRLGQLRVLGFQVVAIARPAGRTPRMAARLMAPSRLMRSPTCSRLWLQADSVAFGSSSSSSSVIAASS